MYIVILGELNDPKFNYWVRGNMSVGWLFFIKALLVVDGMYIGMLQ